MKRYYLLLLIIFLWSHCISEPHIYDFASENTRLENFHYANKTPALNNDDKLFIILVSSLATGAFFVDGAIRNYVQDEVYGGSNTLTELLYGVGDLDNVFFGALAVYSFNTALQDPDLHDTLIMALQSMAVTEGITVGFKGAFGRARPRHSPNDPYNFGGNGESFFSGHSSGAWAYSTVLASRYPSVKWLAYGLAGCVSVSRVYEDAHWTSDVLTGALAGYIIGKLTVHYPLWYMKYVNILPYVDVESRGVLVQVRFW